MTELNRQARDLLRRFPLIDGHNDLPWALRERAGGDVSQVRLAPAEAGIGHPAAVNLATPVDGTHTDLPRLAADHVEHVREVAGLEHVGLGGDFDGTPDVTLGLEDVSAESYAARRPAKL